MSVEIRCQACGKRYRVDERFTGKMVKCRNCGKPIAVSEAGDSDLGDLSALSAIGADADEPVSAPRSFTGESQESPEEESSGVVLPGGFGPALRAARSRHSTREFRLLSYPGVQFIDRGLPWIVGAACLIPTIWQGVEQALAGDPKWIPFAEFGVIFVFFIGLVIPVTARGLKTAGTMLNFALPGSTFWRVLGLFSLPLALGAAFYWQIGLGGLIFGLVVGVLLDAPLILLVFQLHWVEALVAWMMASLFFAASTAVVAGVVFLLGLAIAVSTTAPSGTANKPVAKAPVKSPAPGAQIPPATMPTTMAGVPPVEPPPPATNPTVATVNPSPTPVPPPGNSSFLPIPTPRPVAPPPATMTVAPPVAPKPEPVKVQASPIVVSVKTLDWAGEVDAMLPSQISPSPLALRSRTNDQERIQIADAQQDKATGSVQFKRDPTGSDRYLTNAAGDEVLRVASWPKISVELWNAGAKAAPRSIALNESNGTPTLLASTPADMLLIQWQSPAGQFGMETWNLRTLQHGRQWLVPSLVENGVAVSPDGKTIALAAKTDGAAQVQLYNSIGGLLRRLPITSIDPRWPLEPAGLCFSQDSARVAICFEHEGGLLFLAWNVVTGKQVTEHVYPAGMLPVPGKGAFTGRALDWIAGNDTWLLYGQTAMDVASGQALGALGVDNVSAQHVADAKSVDLQVVGEDKVKRIVRVELNTDEIAKLRATISPAK